MTMIEDPLLNLQQEWKDFAREARQFLRLAS